MIQLWLYSNFRILMIKLWLYSYFRTLNIQLWLHRNLWTFDDSAVAT